MQILVMVLYKVTQSSRLEWDSPQTYDEPCLWHFVNLCCFFKKVRKGAGEVLFLAESKCDVFWMHVYWRGVNGSERKREIWADAITECNLKLSIGQVQFKLWRILAQHLVWIMRFRFACISSGEPTSPHSFHQVLSSWSSSSDLLLIFR
jgi:hypothetical protein